jgi:spore germination cell wall hydrolase CwlJ-like protein
MSMSFYQDVQDLALTAWKEARGGGEKEMAAVATSILNRVNKPCWWGRDIHSVVWKKWQYSSMTAPNDPQLSLQPKDTDPSWIMAKQVAANIYSGNRVVEIGNADSYYDISLDKPPNKPPVWATPQNFVTQIGRLKFYETNHDHEAPMMAKTLPPEPPNGSALV